MPKLSDAVMNERKELIEAAANDLFIKQGFHATSMRDIAKSADVSLGNVYNYFPTKEAIFESIVDRYVEIVDEKLKNIFLSVDEPFHPQSLHQMGTMLGTLVNEHSDFWLLMYIDVLEFQNRHFSNMFEGLSLKFNKIYGEKFAIAKQNGDLKNDIEPAAVFTAAYMQFFNYFLVEKLFGGNRHLGLDDANALECITSIFSQGILSDAKLEKLKQEQFSANA